MSAVAVFVDGEEGPRRAGTLHTTTRRGRASSTFTFHADYLSSEGAYSPEPAWQLTSGAWPTDGALPRSFQDAAPDRWGRHLIAKRHRAGDGRGGSRTLTDVDYLLGVSDETRQGALRFSVPPDPTFVDVRADVPKLVELPRLLAAADLVARDEGREAAAVKELLDAGTGSLGGARPKASVRDGEALSLAKFGHHHDGWDVMVWESTMLQLAQGAGLTVPEWALHRVGDAAVLLMRRFDRDQGTRIGYVSAMTMLEKADGERGDYADVADAVTLHSPRAHADVRELWRRIAFSVAVNNTDDHLRNHGFLRTRGGWQLSPVFDVNPNPALGAARATSLLGQDTQAGTAAALRECAPEFDIDHEAARDAVGQVCDAVASWRVVADELGAPRADVERFAPVFEAGLAALKTV